MTPEEEKFLEEYTTKKSVFDRMNERDFENPTKFPFEVVGSKSDSHHWFNLDSTDITNDNGLTYYHYGRGHVFYEYPKVEVFEQLFDDIGSDNFVLLEKESEERNSIDLMIGKSSTAIGFKSKDDLMKFTLSY